MSAHLDLSAKECDITVDRGGTHVTTWTIPGTGDLVGTVTIELRKFNAEDLLVAFNGTIIDASARRVQFTFSSSATATLPSGQRLRYRCVHTVGLNDVVVAAGAFNVKGFA